MAGEGDCQPALRRLPLPLVQPGARLRGQGDVQQGAAVLRESPRDRAAVRGRRRGRAQAEDAAAVRFMEQFALDFVPQRRVYQVSELNAAISDLLFREFHDVWVAGETSGVKLAPSGHYYFTLKERDSQLHCVM